MDALESLAGMLATLPDEAVEGILNTYDALVRVSDAGARPQAAQLLRQSAASATIPGRRDRLLQAAEAVALGRQSGFPEPLPVVVAEPEFPEEVFVEDDEEDDDEISPYMDEEPPKLPDLPVRFFFPGLTIRVARDFSDAYGRAVCSTDLIRLINCVHENGEYAISCLDRNIRLKDDQAEIVANAGNTWFQPIATTDCLEDLIASIEDRLAKEEEDDDADLDRIDQLREDIDLCQAWVAEAVPRPPAPRCRTSQLAVRLFGQDHELSVWVRLLFAAVQVA